MVFFPICSCTSGSAVVSRACNKRVSISLDDWKGVPASELFLSGFVRHVLGIDILLRICMV